MQLLAHGSGWWLAPAAARALLRLQLHCAAPPPPLRAPRHAGGGEFGEVYKAKWHGSYVAAKVLKRSDEIALGDFRTEIAILRKVHHPNCVQVRGRSGRASLQLPAHAASAARCLPGCAAKRTRRAPAACCACFSALPAACRRLRLRPRPHLACAGQFLGACTKQKPYIVITELMACSLADAFLKTFYAPTQRRQVRARCAALRAALCGLQACTQAPGSHAVARPAWPPRSFNMQRPAAPQVEVALDFARGMAYLHSRRQPIVHRCAQASRAMCWQHARAGAAPVASCMRIMRSLERTRARLHASLNAPPPCGARPARAGT